MRMERVCVSGRFQVYIRLGSSYASVPIPGFDLFASYPSESNGMSNSKEQTCLDQVTKRETPKRILKQNQESHVVFLSPWFAPRRTT